VSAALYPITVIKTRLQVVRADSAQKSASAIVRHIMSTEGIRGLYRGFGIVITGAIPSRMVFMTSLETTKAAALKVAQRLEMPEASAAAFANGAAGLVSSTASQTVFVPLDVVIKTSHLLETSAKAIECWIRH
jgi:solute carrier family 25 protein 44